MTGLELNDQMSGERLFFAVNSFIENIEMSSAIVHNIKSQKLDYCSKQTLCPDFYSTDSESFGQNMKRFPDCPEEPHGVRLLPKLNWFEVFVFTAFLFHLTFALMVAILFYFNQSSDALKLSTSVLGAGLTAPTVTQMVGYSYRSVVKTHYNSKCSPMRVESNRSSTFWSTFRVLFLLSFLLLSVLFSILSILLITGVFRLELDFIDSTNSEAMTLIVLFMLCCAVTHILWIPLFANIRFLFRLIFYKPKSGPSDLEPVIDYSKPSKPATDQTTTPSHSSKTNKSEKSGNREEYERSGSVKSKKEKSRHEKSWSEKSRSEKENSLGEDKPYSAMSKDNELNTGSVIVKPTKSLGYIDPKMFRLTESSIETKEDLKDKDKHKDKDKEKTGKSEKSGKKKKRNNF